MDGTGLAQAREQAASGQDQAAIQSYLAVLRRDPDDVDALIELGSLATTNGHRAAAMTAFRRAILVRPGDARGYLGIAALSADAGDTMTARHYFNIAINLEPANHLGYQGLCRLDPASDLTLDHWHHGFAGNAVTRMRHRGAGAGVALLLLVSARGGNIPTAPWIDDRIFAVTAIFAEFFDPAAPLPPHEVIVNAIGDADLCIEALQAAEAIVARCAPGTPIINHPAKVRATGRVAIAARLRAIPGVITPDIALRDRKDVMAAPPPAPVILRTPGHHTGQHCLLAERADSISPSLDQLPGDRIFSIQYLDARAADGLARKYRVMLIGGIAYPVHLAISPDWKVHYFTAAMANAAALRAEEQRFLENMQATLGPRAISALAAIQSMIGLDYAGIDFALSATGDLMVFEANATMALIPPDDDPVWHYRRPAITAAITAARRLIGGCGA
ncbi:hypothetical protein [Acidiphilium sp.]|uniref:hypothetical protein n=1 Tax=Acidiphilium sp. TaxID=527 RepID=UPI003D020426